MNSCPNRGGRSPKPRHLSEFAVAGLFLICLKPPGRPASMARYVLKLTPDESAHRSPPRTGRTELHRGRGPGRLFRDVSACGVDHPFRPPDLGRQTATRLAARSRLGIPALPARVVRLPLARIVRAWFLPVALPLHSPSAPARRRNMPAATARLQARFCRHRSLFCGALSARASICACLVCNTATYRIQSARQPAYQGSQLITNLVCALS